MGPLLAACAALFLWTAPGRIVFPDDEIVFQTTASLVDHRTLAIAGIPRRTGEPKGRPSGTFGWATGVDGRRYGFFGHALSLAAAPLYALARATAPVVPFAWTRAPRPDHYTFHVRSAEADWLRIVVSLTNCLITAATAAALAGWLARVGFSGRASLWAAVAYATGTSAWPYARTFLSEPLSALVLVLAARWIADAGALRGRDEAAADRRLWAAGAAAGLLPHVHVLGLLAWPCLALYAWMVPRPGVNAQVRRAGPSARAERRGWIGAALLAALGGAALLASQWLRFGEPLETGRYGHYSGWCWPWEGLWAQMLAPGRSFWLYSPAALLGLVGAAAAWRRAPAAVVLAGGLLATRWIFVSARTDWWGGWGIGPRYLVPAIPFVMLGFAAAVEGLPRRPAWARGLFWAGLAGSVALTFHLATHSIFEWMSALLDDPRLGGGPYLAASHYAWWASPIAGFSRLKVDVLAVGAWRLAWLGHPGLFVGFAGVLAVGVAAWIGVARRLRADRGLRGRK